MTASSIATFLNLLFVSGEENVAILLETSRNAAPAWIVGIWGRSVGTVTALVVSTSKEAMDYGTLLHS
jgi:hypothetical protein